MNNLFRIIILIFGLSILLTGCIEDSFSTSPSDQPEFSTDTLSLGTIFTDEPSATGRFVVYNRHSKGMVISSIALSGASADAFHINVDGITGTTFRDVEIRAKDSIFVLVEAKLPELKDVNRLLCRTDLNFTTNGVTRSVVLEAEGQNVTRLRGVVLDEDTRYDATRPYQVFDSLVVSEGAKLTLEQGTQMLFHDGARLIVRGTLQSEGVAGNPVIMAGDRQGNVVGDISFDIMSNQWDGVMFASTSSANSLAFTEIKNTRYGVLADTAPLTLINCRLRNSGGTVFAGYDAQVKAVGSEFAEAGEGLVDLYGGNYVFNHCTFANYYLFSVISGPAIDFNLGDEDAGELHLDVSNSIIYGLGAEISKGDITEKDIHFRNCLFRSEGSDDGNFIDCIWDTDPLFFTVRDDYYFDYRLRPDSPAIGVADAELTLAEALIDWFGNERGPQPDLGAYVFQEIDNIEKQ